MVDFGVNHLTQPLPFFLLSCSNGRRPRAHDTDFNYHGCDLRNYDLCRIRNQLGPPRLAASFISNQACTVGMSTSDPKRTYSLRQHAIAWADCGEQIAPLKPTAKRLIDSRLGKRDDDGLAQQTGS
jgi:hypothetical protein